MKNLIFILLLLCPTLGISETTKQHELLLITRDLHKAQRRIELVKGDYGSGDDVDMALNIVMASIIQLDEAVATKQKGKEFQNMAPAKLDRYLEAPTPVRGDSISFPIDFSSQYNETITKTLPSKMVWKSDFIALGENRLLYSDALVEFLNSLQSWQSGAAKIQFLNLDKDAGGYTGVLVIYPTVKERDAEKK